jgi:hypothetical protein
MPDFSPIIRIAYEEILERAPDPQGLSSYNRAMNQGLSEAGLRESLLRSAEFAANHPDQPLASRIGLNVHIPSDAILQDVGVGLGIRWVRVDFDWPLIEPASGDLRWGEFDRVVDTSLDLGVEVLGVLSYTPAWASSVPGNPQRSDPPASTAFWTNIVRRAVERYRDRVRFWQLWNEPNVREFWSGSMVQYRRDILESGGRALKETHPAAAIVSPGLANLGNWRSWFREALQARDLIDVVNHHNYADTGRETLLELERDTILRPSLRTLMRELGVDGRPFWLTETGRRSDEGDQLEYYQDLVSTLREKSWVERVFFFHYWDGPGQGNGGFGIVNENFSPKPAYRFLQSILRPRAAAA